MRFSVRNVLGIGSALFVLAAVFLIGVDGRQATAVMDAFRSQSVLAEAAWIIVVLVPVITLPFAIWLSGTAQALEARLDGVHRSAKTLAKSQAEIETAVQQLVRTDPEDAIAAAQQRFTEAERFAQIQERRNEIADLTSRVDDIRDRQRALQQRLAPIVEKRRSIERLFTELDSRQEDIERILAELGQGDDAVGLDVRLKKMTEFVARSHERCDDIERAAQAVAGLKEDFAELQDRLAPFAAAEDGIARRLKELSAARDELAAGIDSLLQTPEGPLADRVQKLADEKNMLDGHLAQMTEQFFKLATLRKDASDLFAGFDRALDALAIGGASDADARVEELTMFVKTTQAHLDGIERRLASFVQLQARLDELQARLVPLEAEEGGVVGVIDKIRDIRDRLAARIKRMEESEGGDLGERLRQFTETRRELEERVATLADQVLRLAAIRRDISGLFDKLSSAVSASAI